jgi:hypothetical protein
MRVSSPRQLPWQRQSVQSTARAIYNIDVGERNILGYPLIHAISFEGVIRCLQLKLEAYAPSGNVYHRDVA